MIADIIFKVVVKKVLCCSHQDPVTIFCVLQAARQKIQTLETSVENFLSRESKMRHMIRSLEQERAVYQRTIERMRSSLPPDALTDVEMTQIKTGPNGKAKTAAKKP